MDAYLAIASKRDERSYADRPLPDDVVTRIFDAGRVSGSSMNKQDWQFVVVSDKAALAETVYAPDNIRTAALAVAIVSPRAFDTGRAAQNMMLAAWNDGVASCPNGVRDEDGATRIVGAAPSVILSFGYPARPRDPESRSAKEWSSRANRKPLEEVVVRR
ncbi:MAG TPA: nitroreductase family protein [Candidatus Binatia bacterium]|nr:nitroreductase family protein [Candidatus Binatia bacterium]